MPIFPILSAKKEEVEGIISKVEKLVDATGESAKKLAIEINEDINNLLKKI